MWLVDLDDLPCLPLWLRTFCNFNSSDHLKTFSPTPRNATIKMKLDHLLRLHGINLADGKVKMLAQSRVFGYVFNPLTVYWCYYANGSPACTVAEVHNTYRQSHCYVLHPDELGKAMIRKDFYVSPFFPVSGAYLMSLPEPGERLTLSVSLFLGNDKPVFVATLRGNRNTASTANLLRISVCHPFSTTAVMARIRWQGIRLYLMRLPITPRMKLLTWRHAPVFTRHEKKRNDSRRG
jgi:DUF1365 family protein